MSDAKSFPFPEDRYYEKRHHIWCAPNPDSSTVIVGIDVLGLESMGDLSFISLEAVGSVVEKGDSLGTLEAAKMTGDIISPIAGTIAAHNEEILRDPLIVNQEPYAKGWLIWLEPENWERDASHLINGEGISPWVQSEIERYKEQGWID